MTRNSKLVSYFSTSSSNLTIFIISFISSLEIINVVRFAKAERTYAKSKHFLMNVADAAAVNPNGIKTLLTNYLSTFLIKGNPGFSNGPKSLPKNPPDCPILCS